LRKPTLRRIFSYDATKVSKRDPLQANVRPSDAVQERIRAIPERGTRRDLPKHLTLPCHRRVKSGAIASYGRIDIDGDAPTMTTRCTTAASGSFIHPTAHRQITLREAALIQTFPSQYKFAGGRTSIERQIGNALPVRMARGLGLVALSFV
jgi:DNA (cytosine-5)-methyltransferase 1